MSLYDERLTLKEINKLLPEGTKDIFYHESKVKELIQKLKDDVKYYDNQPIKGEFSRGFEACCFAFRKRIEKLVGEELDTPKTDKANSIDKLYNDFKEEKKVEFIGSISKEALDFAFQKLGSSQGKEDKKE